MTERREFARLYDSMFLLCRLRAAPFYVNDDATYTKDFICSTAGYGGMTTCDDVPPFQLNGVDCNGTLQSLLGLDIRNFTDHAPLNLSASSSSSAAACINWNAYYTDCRAGSTNPFQGSISFDNIGLAWIAIFQVTR